MPVGAGAEADGAGLDTVRLATALELLGEEPAIEADQPLFDGFPVKVAAKSPAGHGENLRGGVTVANGVVDEEIMQSVRAYQISGPLAIGV